jgi:hypothetical protein
MKISCSGQATRDAALITAVEDITFEANPRDLASRLLQSRRAYRLRSGLVDCDSECMKMSWKL